jgi:hypothetical protein
MSGAPGYFRTSQERLLTTSPTLRTGDASYRSAARRRMAGTTKRRIADAAVTEQGDHGKNGAITEMSERSGIRAGWTARWTARVTGRR